MQIELKTIGNEARADSRDIAQALGNQHENVMSLLNDYREDFEALGILRFETGKSRGRGQPAKFALLGEDHCYFLLTLVRNSEQVVPLKRGLVQAFRAARERLNSAPPALPSDPLELLALSLAGLQQHRARLAAIEVRLDTAPIRGNSQMRARIYAACQTFARVHPRGYSGAYRAFKEGRCAAGRLRRSAPQPLRRGPELAGPADPHILGSAAPAGRIRMSRLRAILTDLISRAGPGQPAPATRLPSGLRVAVRTLPSGARQLSLTRTETQKPSVKEAEVCRDSAHWPLASIEEGRTRTGLPCLLVTEART